jgi:hypothetical protein
MPVLGLLAASPDGVALLVIIALLLLLFGGGAWATQAPDFTWGTPYGVVVAIVGTILVVVILRVLGVM